MTRVGRAAVRILGIDPGSRVTGWGLLEGTVTHPLLVECGAIRLAPKLSFAVRLGKLQRELSELVARVEPMHAAVESPFHGASARSALQLAHARGVILAVLAQSGVAVAEYEPASVKKAVTGNGRADKRQVGEMVRRLLGAALPSSDHDVSDALAVALCHLGHAGFEEALRRRC